MTNQQSFNVDFSKPAGRIRPLHGANNGPIVFGGLLDLSKWHRELAFPHIRLHDCQWPADSIVDIHAVFPRFEADASRPESYDFNITDEYIRPIVEMGSQIVYRLGCRIEHTKHRRHAHPPKDPAQWARICVGVIRHYTEGWADGFAAGTAAADLMSYWEIWNEPDWPPGCWSGTPGQYYELYATAAKAIKKAFPHLKVGGPSYAHGTEKHDWVEDFLSHCAKEEAPLDFFSWHTYVKEDLATWGRRAGNMRQILDRHGYPKTETHLNEWNCHPDGSWQDWPAFGASLWGPRGASGDAATLIYFQDLPIDVACYYTADTSVYGLFNQLGEPQKNFYALKAFRQMLHTPLRCEAAGGDATQGLAILAGLAEDGAGPADTGGDTPGSAMASAAGGGPAREGGRTAQVLLANYVNSGASRFPVSIRGLPWSGPTQVTVRRVDAAHSLDVVRTEDRPAGELAWEQDLPNATVELIEMKG